MSDSTIIRRSPIVLILNFIIIEIAAFIVFFFVSGHGDYEYNIYSQLFFSKLLPYNTAKLLFLSSTQLLITIYAFLRWYYELYIVSRRTITNSRGVFFRKKKTFSINKSMAVTVSSGLFGKMFHYGSINFQNDSYNSIVLKTISRPESYLKIIEEAINPNIQRFIEKPDFSQIISQEENENLEFKSSLRFDHKIGQINRDLEKAVMKSIAAFLNSKGGHLVIGVDDSKKPIGLHHDYQTLQRKDSDGFENHFTQVFNAMIGPEFRQLIKLWFYNIEDYHVCVIQIGPSHKPVYLKLNDAERFYIRTGNIVTDLKLSEIESYARSRWPS